MEKKRIFTIRKLKTGVASVGIAVIFLGVSAVQVRGSEVSAEELPNQTVIEGNLVRNEGALDESLSTVNKEIIQEADLTESQAEIEILEGSTSVNDDHIPVESSPEAVPIPYDAPVENNPTNTISSSNIKSANTDFEAQESSVLRNQEVILVEDKIGPEIIDISVNKELYRRNEIMFVTVELKDESPIEELDISFYESSGGYRSTSIQVLITEFEKNEAGNYVGTGYATTPTSISNTDAEFYLSSVTATDIYGNTTSVNSSAYDVVDVRFKVSDKPELNAPEILEVKLDKGVYAPGEEVEITVLATDDSLVSSAGLEFHGDQYSDVRRPRVDIISFVKDETGNYVGTGKIKIPDFTISDTYRLNNVYVSDKYGNGASYNPEWNISDIHLRAIFKVAVNLKVFEETRSEIITFNTELLDNPEILVGTEIVVQEGIDGLQNILEKITTVSGNEISREIISTELISNPVSAIVHRGTKAAVIENVAQTTENVKTLKLIAFETEYIDNPNLLLGLQEIVQEGVDGTRTIVEKVITVAGEEISREIINDTIVVPINKVVQRGTAAVIKDTIATDVIRYEGSNREAVAINVARAHFGDSKKVIIVNRDKFPDAISATNISQGKYPVIYTRADRIDQITLDLIKSLPLDEVYILGGTGLVNASVINQIKSALGVAITRIDGKDRFEVNANAIEMQ